MADNVELSVRSQLKKVIEELQQISAASENVGESLKKASESTGEQMNKQVKRTETFMSKLRSLSSRVADQIKGDFKALVAINAIKDSLKLSEQFRGSIKEAFTLSDTIRRLGSVFGITSDQAGKFQSKIASSLGKIGISSEAAANALEGLAETPVRDQNALIEYSKTAAQLGSIGKEKGREGGIAKGLARLVVARGGNANDVNAMSAARDEVLRIMNATGRSATEVQASLEELYSATNESFKPMLKKGGAGSLAAASLIGGKDAAGYLQKYMAMDPATRAGAEAQGLGKIVGAGGELNLGAMNETVAEAKRRGYKGDVQQGLTTMGMTEEEAKGFMRLTEAMNQNKAAIDKARIGVVDINKQYYAGMGFGEAFKANINRVKGALVDGADSVGEFVQRVGEGFGLGAATAKMRKAFTIGGATDMLAEASQSPLAAGGVVAGGGLLAALLAGGGLRGIGKGLFGTALKSQAAEAMTGEKTIPVYVVNASEIAGGLPGAAGALAGGTAGKVAGMAGKAGMVGLAGAAGYAVGTAINEYGPTLEGKTSEGYEGGLIERLFFKLDKLVGGEASQRVMKEQKVMVELRGKDLKATKQPTRGASFGP